MLRQAVVAARELEPVAARLREAFGLGEPYADPAVAAFGLRNAVFALGDTFLEVVSPVQEGTAAGRWLERRGGDCGYMAMFEVDDLGPARRVIAERRVRSVLEVELEDMAEIHLHPADIGGAIVSVSRPQPPGSWRWGGPDWQRRSGPAELAGITVSVADPAAVAANWSAVVGAEVGGLGISFTDHNGEAGIVEIALTGPEAMTLELGRIRLSCRPRV